MIVHHYMRMILRRILWGTAASVLAFGLLPATSAHALDDLVCVKSAMRYMSGHNETIAISYCAEWQWIPTKSAPHTPSGQHDPVGGKGANPDHEDPPRTCDVVRDDLKAAEAELELTEKQLIPARQWAQDAAVGEAKAFADVEVAWDDWEDTYDDVVDALALYLSANDLEAEIEVSPKVGVVITRTRTAFNPDPDLLFGADAWDAIYREENARVHRDNLVKEWEAWAHAKEDAVAGFQSLVDQRAALLQYIERLRGELGTCPAKAP
jgi:hypothetical protein